MLKFPKEAFTVFQKLFEALDFSEAEKKTCLEEFEKNLYADAVAAVVKKLPDQEQKAVVELANSATTEEERSSLQKKLTAWLNEKEVNALFQKTADRLFESLLQHLYKAADEEKKKKLEKLFKPEVLRG